MPTPPLDTRITIRLQPYEIRRLHRLLKALSQSRGYLPLLTLGSADADHALDLLQRIPNIVPATTTATP